MIAEQFQLSVESFLDGPSDDRLADIDGHGFDRIEVDLESRPFVSVRAPRGDFSPPIGHVAKLGQILGLRLGERHRVFVLELAVWGNLGNSY